MLSEEKLRQLFKNRSDCYIDMEDDSVVQGLSEDGFIDIIKELNLNDKRVIIPPAEISAAISDRLMAFDNPEVTQRLDIEKLVIERPFIKPLTRQERRKLKKPKS